MISWNYWISFIINYPNWHAYIHLNVDFVTLLTRWTVLQIFINHIFFFNELFRSSSFMVHWVKKLRLFSVILHLYNLCNFYSFQHFCCYIQFSYESHMIINHIHNRMRMCWYMRILNVHSSVQLNTHHEYCNEIIFFEIHIKNRSR